MTSPEIARQVDERAARDGLEPLREHETADQADRFRPAAPPKKGGCAAADPAHVKDQRPDELGRILRKVSRVVLPLCFLAGVFNYLDRTNLTFAALELNAQFGFNPADYGLASAMFYLGYGLAMVPSTFMTMRYGARLWYSSITIAWGAIACCTALVSSRASLLALRLLLGLAEAGCITSAFHLLSQFWPREMTARVFAFMSLSWISSSVFAAPLAAGLLSMHGAQGLAGWQWLFIIEGVPTVLLGLAMLVWLPSGPLTAWMLTASEAECLHLRVHGTPEAANAAREPVHWAEFSAIVADAARRPLLWYVILIAFLQGLTTFSMVSWLTIVIKNMLAGTALSHSVSGSAAGSRSNTQATLLTAVPFLFAAAGALLNGWLADRAKTSRRKDMHIALPTLVGGVALACFSPLYSAAFAGGFAVLVVGTACAYAVQGVMFARVAASLEVKYVGVGLSILNAVPAMAGGFAGPAVVGALVQRLGSFSQATVVLGVLLAVAGVLAAGITPVEQLAGGGGARGCAACAPCRRQPRAAGRDSPPV